MWKMSGKKLLKRREGVTGWLKERNATMKAAKAGRIVVADDPAYLDSLYTPQYEPKGFTDGAEGMIVWAEEMCSLPIYAPGDEVATWVPIYDLPKEPHSETGKTYWGIWEEQKAILRRALQMVDGRFLFNLIVLCWMRGEGKSLLACLIQLWKFFCWPRQQIMLGANSRDQVKFVHFDIMRDMILESPPLLKAIGSRKNIQEKEIRLLDEKGEINSIIRSISSFSGIVSNITGFTFSEIFDMKNPKFYSQLYGSIRNIPNALGVIDSTVSDKKHILYQLYDNTQTQKTKKVFFSYRFSASGTQGDYWNPNMTDDQLNDYRVNFPFGDFERYFLNLWTAGAQRVFTDEEIEEWQVAGINGELLNTKEVKEAWARINEWQTQKQTMENKGIFTMGAEVDEKIFKVQQQMRYFETPTTTRHLSSIIVEPTLDCVLELTEVFDTNWVLLAGVDMADPMAVRGEARTMLPFLLKGLPGSRSHPVYEDVAQGNIPYLYILLRLCHIVDHSLSHVKELVDEMHEELGGVQAFCGERWGIWDMQVWCEEREIAFTAVYPTYDRQKEGFKELYIATKKGRFKAPPVHIAGAKGPDILREEAAMFDHDPFKKWFGSPEKFERHGVQDDSLYGIIWGMYGGRMLGSEDFVERATGRGDFGLFVDTDRRLQGRY